MRPRLDAAQRSWIAAAGEPARQRQDFGYFEVRKKALVKALERATTAASPEPSVSPTKPVGEGPAQMGQGDGPEPPATPKPALAPTPVSRVHGPVLGMVIAASATVAFSLAAGVLTGRVQRKGRQYARILDAYQVARINPYVSNDLCDPATHAGDAGIDAACDQHAAIRKGAISMWSLGAAAAITMGVFAVLTARAGRPASNSRRAALGLMPNRTSVMLDVRLDF